MGLLLVMAIPLCFCAGILLKQKILQLKRKARFETEMMQTISVLPNQLHWVKKGKEAKVDGKLFDVESFSVSNNKIILTGFFDHKEESLEEQLRELAEEHNDASSPFHTLSITKIIFAPVYSEPGYQSVQCPWQVIQRPLYAYSEIVPHLPRSAETPPPKYS